jgi:hypothetical protein
VINKVVNPTDGMSFLDMFKREGIKTGIDTAVGIYNNAQLRGLTREQIESNDRAADLVAKANADTLAWLKEQDALNRSEHAATEAKKEADERARLARFAPYRRAGVGSLGQLMQPISGWGKG